MESYIIFSSLGEGVFHFVLAFILGGLIGIQKDVISHTKKITLLAKKEDNQDNFSGIRSFGLIALLGALMQYMDQILGTHIILTVFGFLLISIFVNIDYIYSVFQKQKHSPATEIVAIFVFFLGVLIFLGFREIAIILAIALSLILSLKETLHSAMNKISRDEINTTLKFAAIAFVILPLLPDIKYSFATFFETLGLGSTGIVHPIWTMTFFNPYSLWLFVVIMSGISYIGYILTRIFGSSSGILLSSLMGGMISSTAVTASMSEESKKYPHNTSLYTTGALLASGVMFLRVIAIVGFTYGALLGEIFLPALVMFLVFMASTAYFYYTSKQEDSPETHIEEKVQSPFSLTPALKFAGFILMIKFIAALGMIYKDIWGESLFYYTLGIISGLADVDAITQTMSADAKTGGLTLAIAGTTILIAVISNNLVKGSLAYRFGESQFGKKVLFSFVASGLAGIITIILV